MPRMKLVAVWILSLSVAHVAAEKVASLRNKQSPDALTYEVKGAPPLALSDKALDALKARSAATATIIRGNPQSAGRCVPAD
eukprot:Skav232815  [mRNA]  locus=scaffold614:565893:575299:- [translate_table: standard]